MNSKVDVVITFYGKEWAWPLVRRGLSLNKDHINTVILAYDGPIAPILEPPEGLLMEVLTHPKDGWGAAKCVNEGAERVETEFFLNLDGDMMLATNSVQSSLKVAEPDMLLACQIHDTTKDAGVIDTATGTRVRAGQIRPETRPSSWRSPTPLNLRHGHFLAHTKSWRELGGQDLTPPFDTQYHSMDYHLAARWMMAYGREAFEFGGGAAFHIGGIYEGPVPEAESNENKARVQAMLDQFQQKFPEEKDAPKWFEGKV